MISNLSLLQSPHFKLSSAAFYTFSRIWLVQLIYPQIGLMGSFKIWENQVYIDKTISKEKGSCRNAFFLHFKLHSEKDLKGLENLNKL